MKLDLQFGASVHCAHKHCGKLTKVVVNPGSDEVSDLIVQQGFLRKHAWVVPVTQVTGAASGQIVLRDGNEDLAHYPEFREYNVREPMGTTGSSPSAWDHKAGFGSFSAKPVTPMVSRRRREGVATGKEVVGHKTNVENDQRVLGQLDHIVIEEQNGRITNFVMRKGLVPSYFVVPMEKVDGIHDEFVQTSLSQADIESLQPYEPCLDAEIIENLYDAILTEHTPAFRKIEPKVAGGIVHLMGTVPSLAAKNHAAEIARLVPGVIDVQNNLDVSAGIGRVER